MEVRSSWEGREDLVPSYEAFRTWFCLSPTRSMMEKGYLTQLERGKRKLEKLIGGGGT